MIEILFETTMAFLACVAFSIVFNAPRKELPFCGLCGSLGWFIYAWMVLYFSSTVATLAAAAGVTILARFLSYHRQAPSTLYHIPGIMPLVPGMVVYSTMTAALSGLILETYSSILLGLKLAGAIGIGSILILALPYSAFELVPRKQRKKA